MSVKHWYAIYTKARAEKKTAEALLKKDFEVYIPLHKTLRQWSDRKKWVEIPLISSYIFIKSNLSDYFDILNTAGVVRIVGFEGKPASIPEQQINALKSIISENIDVSVFEGQIPEGSPVKITQGPLTGQSGELVKYRGQQKVVLKLDNINASIFINIPVNYVRVSK